MHHDIKWQKSPYLIITIPKIERKFKIDTND